MEIKNVLRGADPELFLVDAGYNLVTSIGRIGGSKDAPRPFADGFAVQEDNVAVEFNIPPASSKIEFVNSISFALSFLEQEVRQQGLSLLIEATAEFSPEQLAHPQAQELGCEPDFNAWTQEINPRPIAPESLRSSGGHLHLGWEKPTAAQQLEVTRAHDLFCGTASILYDKNTKRRLVYGKPGAFRPKMYGVEYRTLSNFWIKSEELTAWLYEQSEKAIAFVNKALTIPDEDRDVIIRCINESDENLFHQLNEKYGIV